MGTLILSISIVLAFGAGMAANQLLNLKKAGKQGCPFKQACLHYDSVETKAAVKRVLTLMIENNVPVSDIKKEIDQSLKP